MLPPDKNDPRTDALIETHKSYDPRIIVFYPVVAVLLLVISAGFAYQQLFKTDEYRESEILQSQRRIITPAPRGDILDREGRSLVVNRPRYSITVNLDELKGEFLREYRITRRNYYASDDKNIPTSAQLWAIARYNVMQRYLDQVNTIIGRDEQVAARGFQRHFNQQLLIPYTLLEDLTPAEYARLAEQLPVLSPLQLTASSVRYYPFNSSAAHTLGYIGASDDFDAEGFPGENLTTFKMRGTTGRDGLELKFNDHLQGKPGYTIYKVDPAGYRLEPPLSRQLPVQGKRIVTSLDIDLQQAAEETMGGADNEGNAGAAVAIDVLTGEVLVLVSKPDYNLNDFFPLSQATVDKINAQQAWSNRAIAGAYPPGSMFKIVDAIAGFRSGKLHPDSVYNCAGRFLVGNRYFDCHDRAIHGDIDFKHAIAKSCNIFFYRTGLDVGAQAIADEARRFGLDRPSGIELPGETSRMNIPDPKRKRARGEPWTGGDTVTLAIGQNEIVVTPLDMACFMASVARNETRTAPTLLHDPNRPRQRAEPIGLTAEQRAALIDAMREVVKGGTARSMLTNFMKLGHLDIAGKTGTAQKEAWVDGKRGIINYAWFAGFAPADNPRIAICVMSEGDKLGEEYGGGLKATPTAGAIFKKYFEKHPERVPALLQPAS